MTAYPDYLVTTHCEDVPRDRVVFMVDGTVPSWQAAAGDHHWDHHRPHGALVQVDDMPELPAEQSLLTTLAGDRDACIVTTMLDADACVAATWLQLSRALLGEREAEVVRRLRAIAFDCDHLGVPESLSDLAAFAANAVAAMKTRPMPEARRSDETPESLAFAKTTNNLLSAARGDAPWPGEQGEAADYWAGVAAREQSLIAEDRVSAIDAGFIVDLRGIDDYVDPRAVNKAVAAYSASLAPSPATDSRANIDARMNSVILSVRRVKTTWADQCGLRYTLGTNAVQNRCVDVDFSIACVWQRLTAEEARRRGKPTELVKRQWGNPAISDVLGFDPWGGRATVGGSGWNTPSKLLPHEVIRIVRGCFDD